MKTKFIRSLTAIVLTGLIVGILLATNESKLKNFLVHYNIIRIEQQASYTSLTYEQQVKNADLVFVGTLTDISPAKWNQDNGEYWTDESSDRVTTPLQYHTLRFDVSQFVINRTESQDLKSIEITVLGPSPLDENADYSLSVGNNVVIFALETELAWKEGNHRKPIIEFANAPELAFFVQFDKPDGPYSGKIIHDLGKRDFTTEDISLPLQDLISQIQSIDKNQQSP